MKKEEIKNYNRLCAEFLGINYTLDTLTFDNYFENYAIALYEIYKDEGKELLECFNFHEDWNCIMKVIEAIEKLEKSYPTLTEKVLHLLIKSEKEAVVQAINQFLIYYNNEQRT